jgi:toxin ParE1/3/4
LARRHLRVHRRGQPRCSRRTVEGIYEQAQALAQYPELGHRYLHSSRDVRILLYGHFRIAYLIKADGNVEVLGVFHGSLDITKYQL